jgi:hypothetical protein
MSESGPHLDEDQLVQAMVDENDLPPTVRGHLLSCERCRAQKAAFQHALAALGQKAVQTAPRPKSAWPPPTWRKTRGVPRVVALWRPLAGAAAVALAVLFFWLGPSFIATQNGAPAKGTGPGAVAADQLMTEINSLAENPLPELYQDLLGESVTGESGSFMRFLIPDVENGRTSSGRSTKGVTTC